MADTKTPAILLLGTQMAVGGAQRLLLSQADWLYRHGYPVVAAFLYDRDGLGERWQAERPYPVLDLQFFQPRAGKSRDLLRVMGGVARLWRLMRSRRFSAIETFTHHSNLLGCLMAWLAGIPVRLATHHGHIEGMSAALERVHAWMINLGIATRLVAVSRDIYLRSLQEGVRASRLVTIPNGVEPVQADPARAVENYHLLPGDPTGPVLLAVGRLTYQKGHSVLLKALPSILKRYPGTRLVLAGDGPLRAELVNQAECLEITGQVVFLGIRSDVAEWMSIADIFVLPSRWEGLPLVLLEAMSAGCAIVSTRVQGVSEVLAENVAGLIVEIEDSDALADVIIKLLADGELRAQLGQAARQRFWQNYRFETMAQQYLKLLDPAVDRKQLIGGDEKQVN